MPCKKCDKGQWKWGNRGECKYATKDECETANPKHYKKMKHKPTPIGKKSYAEYEKQLNKNYNLSTDPKLEKIELGFLDDIKSSMNKAESSLKGMISAINTFDSLNSRSKSLRKEVSNINNDLNTMEEEVRADISNGKQAAVDIDNNLEKIKRAAKDLGLNVKDVPGYNRADTMVQSLNKAINESTNIQNRIDDAYIRTS